MISIRTGKSAGLLTALAICVAGSSAYAQVVHEKGPYIGAGVGINFQEDNKVPFSGSTLTTSYDPGPVGIASFGYAFGNSLRIELEPGFRYNDLDTVDGATAHGRTSIFSAMLNGIWDFENISTPVLPLVPHVGLGVGWAHIHDSGTLGGAGLSGKTDAFAYQVIAGAEYAFTPALKVGLDYRYFSAQDAAYRNGTVITKVGDYDEHAILFTVRYSFGSPAPAAVAQGKSVV